MTATIKTPGRPVGEAPVRLGLTPGSCAPPPVHEPGHAPQGGRAGARPETTAPPRPAAEPFGHHEFELWLEWADDGHDGEE